MFIIFLYGSLSFRRLHSFSELAPPKHAFCATLSTILLINIRLVRMSFSVSTRLIFFVHAYNFNVCSRFSPYAIYVISFYSPLFFSSVRLILPCSSLLLIWPKLDPAPLVTAFVDALLMFLRSAVFSFLRSLVGLAVSEVSWSAPPTLRGLGLDSQELL